MKPAPRWAMPLTLLAAVAATAAAAWLALAGPSLTADPLLAITTLLENAR